MQTTKDFSNRIIIEQYFGHMKYLYSSVYLQNKLEFVDPTICMHFIIFKKDHFYEHYELYFVSQVKEFASYYLSRHKHYVCLQPQLQHIVQNYRLSHLRQKQESYFFDGCDNSSNFSSPFLHRNYYFKNLHKIHRCRLESDNYLSLTASFHDSS